MRVFISYHFADEKFIGRVVYYLKKQPDLETYFYADKKTYNEWRRGVGSNLKRALGFVLFAGGTIGQTQTSEAMNFDLEASGSSDKKGTYREVVVRLPGSRRVSPKLGGFGGCDPIQIGDLKSRNRESEAARCAREISVRLLGKWVPPDGIPIGYPFDYEKGIIEEYAKGQGLLSGRWLELGCPAKWPDVRSLQKVATVPNLVGPEIGRRREPSERILVDARTKYHRGAPKSCLARQGLTFMEAGPRHRLCYPQEQNLNVGILVSGGIAPGINAVISGIVERHCLYQRRQAERGGSNYRLWLYGYKDGLGSLLRDGANRIELTEQLVRENATRAGSMLGTSRCDALLGTNGLELRSRAIRAVVDHLVSGNVDILYVIGGEGSMRAAHAIWMAAQESYIQGKELSVIAIPKTMDNDILWVWQSFGFLSAVEKAKEFVLQLHTEATSNPRLCIVQLFGSDSGFVVSHTALASGVCDAVLIPEVGFSMQQLSDYIQDRLFGRYRNEQRGYGMILAAETAIPTDYEKYLNDRAVGLSNGEKAAIVKFAEKDGRRVHGQTPDPIRTGGLKILSHVLQRHIRGMGKTDPYWQTFRVFTNEPRHLLRAIGPSVSDVVFGQRLGTLAVDNAMAGYTDFMISQWITEYVLVPLPLVVLGRKRVPADGIFWKSVLANTGQPDRELNAGGIPADSEGARRAD